MVKKVLILVLLIIIVILAVQNYEVIEIKLLFWSFSASRALVIFATFVVGLVIGWAGSQFLKQKNKIKHDNVEVDTK